MRSPEFDRELIAATPKLLHFCHKHMWENESYTDLVQDVLLFAMRKHHQYTINTNMSAWLIAIAVWLHREQMRKANVITIEKWDTVYAALEENLQHSIIMGHSYDARIIEHMVKRLKGKQRQLLSLKMKGYSNPELMALTGTSQRGVKNHLTRARHSIKHTLTLIY